MWIDGLVLGMVFVIGGVVGLLVAGVIISSLQDREGAAGWNASEGVYAFIGYISTRPEQFVYPFTDLVREFSACHALPPPREGWKKHIRYCPAPVPLTRFTPSDYQTTLE